jgi:hypothetical protein
MKPPSRNPKELGTCINCVIGWPIAENSMTSAEHARAPKGKITRLAVECNCEICKPKRNQMTIKEKIAILERQLNRRNGQPSPQSQLSDDEKKMCWATGLTEEAYLAARSAKPATHVAQPHAGLLIPSLPYASRAVMAKIADNPNGGDDDDDLPSMSVDELCDRAGEHLAAREDPDEEDPDGRLAKASACLMEALNRRTAPEADGGDFLEMRHSRGGPLRIQFVNGNGVRA